MNTSKIEFEGGSFRDPSGFIFYRDGLPFRQINTDYRENYELLLSSGLYDSLIRNGLLIAHDEVDAESPLPEKVYKIIKPEPINFISYPYEWSFPQLKDAALVTLKIQKEALSCGMSLKDASAFNIQFKNGKPVFIDTLSFERFEKGKPWVAYRQFCQHFLAPLALMGFSDVRLGQMFKIFLDGVPLDLTCKLLPLSAFFRMGIMLHVFLHSRAQNKYADSGTKKPERAVSEIAFRGLIDSLENTVRKIKNKPRFSEWGEYYQDTNYDKIAFESKAELVSSFLKEIEGRSVWDLGANTGVFSKIASRQGYDVISVDADLNAVESNYLKSTASGETGILPLFSDLMNPSPDAGWSNEERMSLKRRGPADCILFLALIHHLAISNNVPLPKIAAFLSETCRFLIIEFVPKDDSQVQRLLSSRTDIFSDYSNDEFEKSFSRFFEIKRVEKIENSKRSLYLMRRIS